MKDNYLNIVLVEDSPSDTELMQIALSESGILHTLHLCEDGEKAVTYLHSLRVTPFVKQPDLILLDLNLPKKSGYDVLKEIRADDFLMNIPVIVLTTTALQKDIKRVLSYPHTRFLTKPFRFDEYALVIQAIKDFVVSVVPSNLPA